MAAAASGVPQTPNGIARRIRSLLATVADKAEIYAGLGLHLTYHPDPRTVITRAEVWR